MKREHDANFHLTNTAKMRRLNIVKYEIEQQRKEIAERILDPQRAMRRASLGVSSIDVGAETDREAQAFEAGLWPHYSP